MARRYLGERFDIHGGGLDLIFPHHENEIAQSKARGDGFANYWMHNAWVTIAGEKMSKSLGNSVLVSEMVKSYRPIVLRYYLVWPHYRSMIEYSPESLAEAATGYERIEQFVRRASELVGPTEPGGIPEEFAAPMDDDLKVPQAIAVVHDTVRAGNTALASDDKEAVGRYLRETRAMLDVLGLDPLGEPWVSAGAAGAEAELRDVVDNLVEVLLDTRAAARASRDFAAADAIRDRLGAAGIVLEDGPHGTRWTLRS
jgi:cysteinyl-tRNA synthetase